MRISSNTRELLATIVCGDIFTKVDRALGPYRTLDQIITFFEDFGERDYFESENRPSRKKYTMEKLNEYNGTNSIGGIITEALEFWNNDEFDVEDTAANLRERLQHDGYRLRIRYHFTRMVGDRVEKYGSYFEVYKLDITEPKLSLINQTSDEHVSEQKSKCLERLDAGDFSGSITSAYTLIESTLKMILEISKIEYKITEGDIRVLYKLLQKERSLNPSSEKIDSRLKPILSGLQNIVSGIFDVSNKAGDRHKRVYEAKFHHAQLAVNSSLILCDFLLESLAARKNKL